MKLKPLKAGSFTANALFDNIGMKFRMKPGGDDRGLETQESKVLWLISTFVVDST